jgi:hypothetical protein
MDGLDFAAGGGLKRVCKCYDPCFCICFDGIILVVPITDEATFIQVASCGQTLMYVSIIYW